MCACRTGNCWDSNNNKPAKKKPSKPVRRPACAVESSDEWSDSESDSCRGCSDCGNSNSSSSCTCTDCCNDSSSDGGGRRRTNQKKKQTQKNKKVLRCKDGVCEWVSTKKLKKEAEKKKAAAAKKTAKKTAKSNNRKCYDCCR